MEYRKAKIEEAQIVCDIVQGTKAEIYPQFHIKEGYTEVAHIKSVGKKFDRWYDLLWFQKKI